MAQQLGVLATVPEDRSWVLRYTLGGTPAPGDLTPASGPFGHFCAYVHSHIHRLPLQIKNLFLKK